MKDFLVVAQAEVTGSLEEEDVLQFSFDHTKVAHLGHQLTEIDFQIRDYRTILFCSINCANLITRNANQFNNLRKGLILNKEFLYWNFYSSLIKNDWLLNNRYVMLPYHKIIDEKENFKKYFGERIFIRPNNPMKPFTGFDVRCDELEDELDRMSKACSIANYELCVIAPFKKLPLHEHRVWIVDSVPVTFASYSWDKEAEKIQTSQKIIDKAEEVAYYLKYNEDAFVIDLVEYDNEAKVVELNALSCSGFYSGMNKQKLFDSINEIII